MSDINGKTPDGLEPMPFGIVTMHQTMEVPGKGQRLVVGIQLQGPGGVPLSHRMEVPGEILPVIIASLQDLVKQYPALTTDLCVIGESREISQEEIAAQQPSGLVDPSGRALKIVKH